MLEVIFQHSKDRTSLWSCSMPNVPPKDAYVLLPDGKDEQGRPRLRRYRVVGDATWSPPATARETATYVSLDVLEAPYRPWEVRPIDVVG